MSAGIAAKLMLYGVILAEQLLLVICFYRFWRASGERIFAFFAAGFLVMAIHRVTLGFSEAAGAALEQQTGVFLWRLASYVLILIGVLVKNRSRASRTSPT